MANPASSIQGKVNELKNKASEAMEKMNQLAQALQKASNLSQALNLGGLTGKLQSLGDASQILSQAIPAKILPQFEQLAGAACAVKMMSNIKNLEKTAKKVSISKSGLAQEPEDEAKEKAKQEKQDKQKQAEDKVKEEAEQKKEVAKQKASSRVSSITQSAQGIKF